MDNRKMVNAQGRAGTNFMELSEKNVAVDLLNELISANRGLADVYKTAVDRLDNETNRALLQEYFEQQETFIAELSDAVVGLSGQPDTDGSVSTLVKQAWVTLKAAVTEGEGPILAEVAEDAESVVNAYGEAMTANLPDEAKNLVRRQMSHSRLAYEKLSALSAAYNS